MKQGPGCWLWPGARDRYGYGQIRGDKLYYTHRIMCPGQPHGDAREALHKCDAPLCCNPSHLVWGTRSRNIREARDRLHNHVHQKLTREQAYAIKYLETGLTYKAIAEKYGVSKVTVGHIKTNRQWRDV